jgi:hypothetical protein
VLTGRGSSSAPLAEPKSTDAVNAVIMAQHQPAVGLEEDNISTWRCWCSSEQAASCNPLNLEPELQTWNLWLNKMPGHDTVFPVSAAACHARFCHLSRSIALPATLLCIHFLVASGGQISTTCHPKWCWCSSEHFDDMRSWLNTIAPRPLRGP